ncbi:MAG: hypothetical protein KAW61_05475 [candidate division Zixibacteria bacterium]|nr:hypothetical protein [candidate division Zixibacteria bacterium]
MAGDNTVRDDTNQEKTTQRVRCLLKHAGKVGGVTGGLTLMAVVEERINAVDLFPGDQLLDLCLPLAQLVA